MKRFTYCGREYPDEANSCAIDEQPLKLIASPSATPKPLDSQINKDCPPQIVVPGVLSDADILNIVKGQKAVIWLILLEIPALVAAMVFPFLYVIYTISVLNADARDALFATTDVRYGEGSGTLPVHYVGIGAEWWFQSSYR